MASRIHFSVTPGDGFVEISINANKDAPAFDDLMRLRQADKIKFPKEEKDIKKIASELKNRSIIQISNKRKFLEGLLSYLTFGCFQSTQDKIRKAYSEVIRKEPVKEPAVVKEEEKAESGRRKDENQNKPEEDVAGKKEEEAKAKADEEARKDAEQKAKEKAEQEAKAADEARLKEEQEAQAKAKEKAEQEAKAADEARLKEEQKAKKAELRAKAKADKAARIEEKANEKLLFKMRAKAVHEEAEKERAELILKLQKEEQDSLNKAIEEKLAKDFTTITDLVLNQRPAEAFALIRQYEPHLQDPVLERLAEKTIGSYYVARAFAVAISDEKRRISCLVRLGLLNEIESRALSQESEEGKRVAALIQERKFEDAVKALESPKFAFWVLNSAILHYIREGNMQEAQRYMALVVQNDLKAEYIRQFNGRIELYQINEALKVDRPLTAVCSQEITQVREFLDKGQFREAIELAVTLPTEVLGGLQLDIFMAYMKAGRFVEARELAQRMPPNLIAHDAAYNDIADNLIARGDREEAIKTVALLSAGKRQQFIHKHIHSSEVAFTLLSQIPFNIDPEWLKLIQNARDESIGNRALANIQMPIFRNLANLALAVNHGNMHRFLDCGNEALMEGSIDPFMKALNEKNSPIDEKEIVRLEAKVDALASVDLRRVLYTAIRRLYNRLPPDLARDMKLSKKIKGLS